MVVTKSRKSGSAISPAMEVCPSRQPKMARAVWRGFRQVHTFMRSTALTVSRLVNSTPAFSRGGRPAGKSSSMTRYWGFSVFTKGAM